MRTSEKHLLLLLENFICKWGRLLELLQPQKIIKSKLNWIPCLIPQNYRDILKTAVTSNASALKYASDDLQNDRDIILTVKAVFIIYSYKSLQSSSKSVEAARCRNNDGKR